MQCEVKPIGEVTQEQLDDVSIKLDFVCLHCKNPLRSKYPPHMIHRRCGAGPQRTGNGPKPPGFIKRVGRYARAMRLWSIAGKPVRTAAAVLHIYETHCTPCEHFNAECNKCKLCGCPVNIGKSARLNKLKAATERCPANKWLSLFDVAVLQCLADGISLGAEIHPLVCKSLDVKMTLPAFYELMVDSEEAGIVVGFWKDRAVTLSSWPGRGDGRQRCYEAAESTEANDDSV